MPDEVHCPLKRSWLCAGAYVRCHPRSPERHQIIHDDRRDLWCLGHRPSTGPYRRVLYPPGRASGRPRELTGAPQAQLERYCELIAAMKLRTTNKQGRHLSTAEAIRFWKRTVLRPQNGFVSAPQASAQTRRTVNRYLKYWGYDDDTLARRRQPCGFKRCIVTSVGTLI